MNRDDDLSFRVKPGARGRGRSDARFVNQVAKAVSQAGVRRTSTRTPPKLSRIGRGHVAAVLAADRLGPRHRRVVVKTRLVNLKRVTPQAVTAHLRYLTRDGIGHDGQPSHPYNATLDKADVDTFATKGSKDRHQFRFIVSPEDGVEFGDLKSFTRSLMARMEADLGTPLQWVAVDHWDTDNPHTHVVLRGKTRGGEDLIIARQYLTEGMRIRASELATEYLGIRSELELHRAQQREVTQERWTGLDRQLQRLADGEERIDTARPGATREALRERGYLIGRLQHLQRLGLAEEQAKGVWTLDANAEPTLRTMGERNDIIKTLQRATKGERQLLAIYSPEQQRRIVGRVVGRGLADELGEPSYLVVDAVDGRAYHVGTGRRDPTDVPMGAIVEVSPGISQADRRIAAVTTPEGDYCSFRLNQALQAHIPDVRRREEVVEAHERRLEALRRAGIVERQAKGMWRVPKDLEARGRAYDQEQKGGVALSVLSDAPVERQVKAIGSTWLDHELVKPERGIVNSGFGETVTKALHDRAAFLASEGYIQLEDNTVMAPRDLLDRLRQKNLAQVAQRVEEVMKRPCRILEGDGHVSGIYRQRVATISGRFALLEDGLGFSLVPWQPVIDQQLGRSISGIMRGRNISWSFGRERGLSL